MHILGYEPAAIIRKQCVSVQYLCGFQVIVHFTSSVAEKFQIQQRRKIYYDTNEQLSLCPSTNSIHMKAVTDFALYYIPTYNNDLL